MLCVSAPCVLAEYESSFKLYMDSTSTCGSNLTSRQQHKTSVRDALDIVVAAERLQLIDQEPQLGGTSMHPDYRLAVVIEKQDIDMVVGIDQL